MTKALRFSAASRAKISDFLEQNAGVHMPTIGQIETAIAERMAPMLEYASRADIIGARISYRSGSPMSSSYRYKVRGLALSATLRSRSIDLTGIDVEKLYPRTRERVDVAMSDECASRIAEAISSAKATEARHAYLDLGISSRRIPVAA